MSTYSAGIRVLGESTYRQFGHCDESGFHVWLKQAGKLSRQWGKKCFVDFRQMPVTFAIDESGSPHLMTHANPIDPVLELTDG